MADEGTPGFWYRVRWNVQYALLTVAGPAALGPGQDPRERMRRERAAMERSARERSARERSAPERGASGDSGDAGDRRGR